MASPQRSDGLSDDDEEPKTARNAVNIALRTATAVRDFIPLEAAKGPLSVLCSFLTRIQMVWQNEDDLKDIAERCTRVALIMERTSRNKAGEEHQDLLHATAKLQKLVVKISKQIPKKQRHSTWQKVLTIFNELEAVEIGGLKESLDAFIAEFQLDASITMSLDIRAILRWVQAQDGRKGALTNEFELYTPPKPMIFCGRDNLVKDIVNTLLLPRQTHIALIGAGGIGKTTISKAILNEEHVATMFSARLFITYDNVDYSLMNYETFLNRIAEALQISVSTRVAILNRIKSLKTALLVIDNAETFVEAGRNGFRDISQTLDEMGALCRIIFTTRNIDTIPTNLCWNLIHVKQLDIEAAVDTFTSIYKREHIDAATKDVLLELECHPLSINILANSASFNNWSLAELVINWRTQRKSRLLEIRKDKYHSVGVAIDLSVSCSDFTDTRDHVMKLLRAVAFLPQGIHRQDLEGILQAKNALAIAESICRCSLGYWQNNRLTVLSPIRMHIMDQYNAKLAYDDSLITSIRQHYYGQIDVASGHCALREHANLDRVFLFDLSQQFVRLETMRDVATFLEELYVHNSQPTSLWASLEGAQPEDRKMPDDAETFEHAKADAMIWMSGLYSRMDHNRTAFEMIEAAEMFCRYTDGLEAKLAQCLREKGSMYRYLGKVAAAEICLQEAHVICQKIGDHKQEAFVNLSLSLCALRRGNLRETTAFLDSAQSYFDPSYEAWTHILLNRAQVELLQGNLDQAIDFIGQAAKNDEVYHGCRQRLDILIWKADVEVRAGNTKETQILLAEVTATEVFPGQVRFLHFLAAFYGQVYYAGINGGADGARDHAARALVRASEGGSDISYRVALLISGYIELFVHEYRKAKEFLHSALVATDAESVRLTAMVYRGLGEVASLEQCMDAAEEYFLEVESLCGTMGIPAKGLYNMVLHWYILPDDQFPAWSSYLARQDGDYVSSV